MIIIDDRINDEKFKELESNDKYRFVIENFEWIVKEYDIDDKILHLYIEEFNRNNIDDIFFNINISNGYVNADGYIIKMYEYLFLKDFFEKEELVALIFHEVGHYIYKYDVNTYLGIKREYQTDYFSVINTSKANCVYSLSNALMTYKRKAKILDENNSATHPPISKRIELAEKEYVNIHNKLLFNKDFISAYSSYI